MLFILFKHSSENFKDFQNHLAAINIQIQMCPKFGFELQAGDVEFQNSWDFYWSFVDNIQLIDIIFHELRVMESSPNQCITVLPWLDCGPKTLESKTKTSSDFLGIEVMGEIWHVGANITSKLTVLMTRHAHNHLGSDLSRRTKF